MATDSIMGLFATPEQYQQQRNDAALTRGIQLAQLTPVQQGAALTYAAGNRLGGAIGSALGAEDPQLKMASARQQILKGVNPQDMKSIEQAAIQFSRMGDGAGVQAMQDLALKQSQVVRNLRERPAKESELATLQAERDALVQQFGANDPRVKQYDARLAKITSGGGIGSEIAAGLAPLVGAVAGAQAKKMGEAGGTEVGKQVGNIQGKYTALGSIKDAVDMLDKGIYSGGYGPAQELAAKYAGGILRKDRLANTQEFRAYIGDVVIPRLQEFGGNDSVEELNYLRSVMAGDTSMEGTAIKNILQKAERKIRAGIDRLEKQQQAVTTGKPLPLGDTAQQPKATKRFNPQTGQLEVVK